MFLHILRQIVGVALWEEILVCLPVASPFLHGPNQPAESVLSCGPLYTCKYKGTAVGCCTNDVEFCSNLYTTCAAATDTCNSLCQSDPLIIKWFAQWYRMLIIYSLTRKTARIRVIPIAGCIRFLAERNFTTVNRLLSPPKRLSISNVITKQPPGSPQ